MHMARWAARKMIRFGSGLVQIRRWVGKNSVVKMFGSSLHAWSDRVFKKLMERWGDLVTIDAATKARTHLDDARLAVLTPIMHHISLSATLKIDKDDFPIFIAEEGMAFDEKAVSWDVFCTGRSEDSSEASFPSIASLGVVPKLVGDDLDAGKFTAAASHWEPKSKAQKSLLVINDSADVVQEEPPRIDGQGSGKLSWHSKLRDDRERMDDGEVPRFEGVRVDILRLKMGSNCADSGDPKHLWAVTEDDVGFLVAA
ncbi:hypothetical protein Ancab_011341 [Ancistrocladus abbreviatus]